MLNNIIQETLFSAVAADEKTYLEDCILKIRSSSQTHFIPVFSTINRNLSIQTRLKRVTIPLDEEDGLIIKNWDIPKLIRVWFIHNIQEENSETYFQFVNRLFEYADVDELTALYASLNILRYPEKWIARCAEGIRSNIGVVLQAVMINNKYPFRYLDENAWGQLVLKSFFTNNNTAAIYGVFERMNTKLADAVIDYIFERNSAKRPINPLLWIFAKPRLNDRCIDILLNRFQNDESALAQSIMLYAIDNTSNKQVKEFYNNEISKGHYLTSLEEIVRELNK